MSAFDAGAGFKRPVGPGDQLRELEVEITRSSAWHSTSTSRGAWSRVDGETALEAELMCTMRSSTDASQPAGTVMALIHPTALVDPAWRRARCIGVVVGSYSVTGPKVRIGAGTRIASHVVIEAQRRTFIGRDNQIYQFCSLGRLTPGQQIQR